MRQDNSGNGHCQTHQCEEHQNVDQPKERNVVPVIDRPKRSSEPATFLRLDFKAGALHSNIRQQFRGHFFNVLSALAPRIPGFAPCITPQTHS